MIVLRLIGFEANAIVSVPDHQLIDFLIADQLTFKYADEEDHVERDIVVIGIEIVKMSD